jgi:hypothetical protein
MTHTVVLVGERQREFAHKLVSQAPVGFVVTVKPQTRSGEQNNLMWQLLTQLSKAKPNGREHSPDTWKVLALHACGHACQFEIGLNGQPFPTGFRSSKLTKAQMSDLVEWIYQYAAEAGVDLGDGIQSNQT